MKISRNSWHFRFLKKVNSSKALDIEYTVDSGHYYGECKYFWIVVWNLLVHLVCFGIAIGAALLILYGMFIAFPYELYLTIINGKVTENMGQMPIVGFMFWMILVAGLISWSLKRMKDDVLKIRKGTKTDSLMMSYIKAKKQKVCKKIEFVD